MDDAQTIPEQYFAAVGRGDVERVLALLVPNADFRTPVGPLSVPDGVRAMLEGYARAFPGNRFEVTRSIASGNEVAVEGAWVAKHTGPMTMPDGSSLPATGKALRVPYATLFKLEGNKIASHHAYWDMAGFLGQLGLG
jgi:steroid delta-isomerase-like uncharacterized protein